MMTTEAREIAIVMRVMTMTMTMMMTIIVTVKASKIPSSYCNKV